MDGRELAGGVESMGMRLKLAGLALEYVKLVILVCSLLILILVVMAF